MVTNNMPVSERIPPHSKDSESSLLSSIFIDGVHSLAKAMDGHISPECFYEPANRQIYQAFLWLHRHGRELTLDVMIEELRKTQRLEAIQVDGKTAIAYLMEVSGKVPTTMELDYHIDRVRETYVMRELIQSGRNVAELAYSENAEVEKFTTEMNRILSIRHSTQVIKTLPEAAKQSIDKAIRIKNRMPIETDIGLEWPWREWNERFGEAKPGSLIIFAARPGIGKSSAARQAAWSWAEKYGDVALFSREMPVDQLPPLFAQTLSGVSWRLFRKNQLDARQQDQFISALGEVQASKTLHVFDRDRTLSHVMARAKALAQTKKLKAILIDYLQRYDPEQSKGENRDIALGRMTMAFKDLAMDLKIPVVLLAQVGREMEREKREPRLSDLRESGNIEQDADDVIFFYPPEDDPILGCPQDPLDQDSDKLYIDAIQAKGRGEGRGRCGLYFQKSITCFRSITPDPKYNESR